MNYKHGHSKKRQRSLTYRTWDAMIHRCHNPQSSAYHKYGGRGIVVCDRWRESFESFLSDMGDRPGPEYSIDRYPDKNGNYEPGNCRWATPSEQARNRRSTRYLTCNGETLSLAEWSERTGIQPGTIANRIDVRGWSVPDALRTPKNHRYRGKATRGSVACL